MIVRPIAQFGLALALVAAPAALAAAPLKIAIVAPLSGNLAILGDQIRAGAKAAAAKTGIDIVEIPETCAEKSGPTIADAIEASGANASIGFLCSDSLDGGLATLAAAKIPAITLSVRSTILMEDALKQKWPFFRLAPSPQAERDLIVDTIYQLWKDKPFALLDDGTIMSRELVDSVRQTLEQKGMKAAFVDNFRPAQEVQTQLMRRLAKANVTHVFAASDRNDMSVMARDARAAGLKLTFLGDDALNGVDQPVPLEPGVLAVTMPEAASLPSAAPVAVELTKAGIVPEGYVLTAYAAVTLLGDAAEIAGASDAPLADALVDTPFETAIGEVRFTATHELSSNPFRLLEWDGKSFRTPPVTE